MILYYAICSLFYAFFYPYFLIRFRGVERKQRTGYLNFNFEKCIWIHAASVGEVNAVKPMINMMLSNYPKKQFVISTMTRTGLEIAKGISAKLIAFYLPLDVPHIMIRVFKRLNPEMIILVETELWPVMLHRALRKGTAVVMVNGRISKRSFPYYKRLSFFWKPLWPCIRLVNAQSDKDAQRFSDLGFSRVYNTSNLKFNMELPDYDRSTLRDEFNYQVGDFIIVWGSSRPGEEKLLRSIISGLKKEISQLKLVIVPRHLTRLTEIKDIFRDFTTGLYSELEIAPEILIVDEMGVLTMFYAIADLAIIGGSFYNFGGHNPLEAAYYGVPIIIGRYHSSCQDSVRILQQNQAILVSDRNRLMHDILSLHGNDNAIQMGINARNTMQKNAHSLKKNMEKLAPYLNSN